MFLVYIWLYTLVLTFIWWFFIVLRIHAIKFKNFSYNISKVTNTLFVILVLLSIFGYILIFYWLDAKDNYDVNIKRSNDIDYDEVDY